PEDREHREASRSVSRARGPQHLQSDREQQRDQRALPQRMENRPAERTHGGDMYQGFHKSHRVPFSNSSITRRSSASSAFEPLRAESAPSKKLRADPLKARSSRSPASCCCVASRGRAAWYTCARCFSLRRTRPLSAMICISFSTVVYCVGLRSLIVS